MSRCPLGIAVALSVVAVCSTDARAESAPEYAARHILVAYKGSTWKGATRTREEARALAEKAAAALAAGGEFAAVARQFSDDKVHEADGGFVGFYEPGVGRVTPKFEETVAQLAPGKRSGVVETPLGFEIVERLSLTDAEALVGRQRAVVTGALFAWKAITRDPRVTRPKELALDDATKAMEHLLAGGVFETLPPPLGAVPLRRGNWQSSVLARGSDVKDVEDQAFALANGAVSKPFESASGYVVLRRFPYFHMRVQHLVVIYRGSAANDPDATRSKADARARAEEALKRYEAEPASWGAVVAQFSDDLASRGDDGNVASGMVEPGMLVPAFDAGIAALKVGEHTKVFETPFGFHVARRVP